MPSIANSANTVSNGPDGKQEAAEAVLKESSRPALIRKLFDLLETAGSGFITKIGMLPLVRMMDFPGDDKEWGSQFEALCEANGCNAAVGFNLAAFANLLNDKEGDMYC